MKPLNEYVTSTCIDTRPFTTIYYYKSGKLVATEKYPHSPMFENKAVDLTGCVKESVLDSGAYHKARGEKIDLQTQLYLQFREDVEKHVLMTNNKAFDEVMDDFMEIAFKACDVEIMGFNTAYTKEALGMGLEFAEKLAKFIPK